MQKLSFYLFLFNLFNYFLCSRYYIIIFLVPSNFTKQEGIWICGHILYIIIYVYIYLYIFLHKNFFTGQFFFKYITANYITT